MNMKLKYYILKSLNLLNLLMTATAIGFFIHFLNPLLQTSVSVTVPAPGGIPREMAVRTDETEKPPIVDYTPIGEKNLFHPDRMTPPGKKSPVSLALPRPELMLHGTMMTSELKIAYVEDKKAVQKTPGRNAPYFIVKEGDTVNGYTLKAIAENMIVLSNGEEQMILYLDELKDRKGEITGPTRTPVQATAATVPPRGAPRPSAVQPIPSAPASPQRGPASLPVSPTAPSGFSGPPNVRYAPPQQSMPAPSPQTRGGRP